MDYKFGQVFEGIYPPEAAAWCNTHGAHIEKQKDGPYVIVENPPVIVTDEARVTQLELKYNLPRPVRTALLLAREAGQDVDAQLMARVDEIEALAAALRKEDR